MVSEQLDLTQLPILGYRNSSGHNNSETSRNRAKRDDSNGTTSDRQRRVLDYLAKTGYDGAVFSEVNRDLGFNSQSSSSVLSNLHKEGAIVRLKEKRSRSHVYVLGEFVARREIAPFKSNICRHCGMDNS